MMGNGGVTILSENEVYKFDRVGNCTVEGAPMTPDVTTGLLQLPVISVLSSGNMAEMALFIDDLTIKKFRVPTGSVEAIMKLQSARGFIRLLTRKGKEDGVRFNQSIFIYPEGFNLLSVIGQINCNEV